MILYERGMKRVIPLTITILSDVIFDSIAMIVIDG